MVLKQKKQRKWKRDKKQVKLKDEKFINLLKLRLKLIRLRKIARKSKIRKLKIRNNNADILRIKLLREKKKLMEKKQARGLLVKIEKKQVKKVKKKKKLKKKKILKKDKKKKDDFQPLWVTSIIWALVLKRPRGNLKHFKVFRNRRFSEKYKKKILKIIKCKRKMLKKKIPHQRKIGAKRKAKLRNLINNSSFNYVRKFNFRKKDFSKEFMEAFLKMKKEHFEEEDLKEFINSSTVIVNERWRITRFKTWNFLTNDESRLWERMNVIWDLQL